MVALGESTTAGGWSTAPDRCWVPLLGTLINDFQTTPMRVGQLWNRRQPHRLGAARRTRRAASRLPTSTSTDRPLPRPRPARNRLRPQRRPGRYALAQFREDLALLVGRVRQRGNPLILLLGPYFMTDFTVGGKTWSHADLPLFRLFNTATAEVAAELDCLYVNLLAASGEAPWMVHYDGVHQNDLGHRIVANRIFEVLAKTVPAWRSGPGRPSGVVRGGGTSRC